jgi:tetratricopeptide (TPR) repeat protein
MKVKMIYFLLCLIFAAFSAAQANMAIEQQMKEADSLYQKFDNEGALAIYQKIVEMDSLNYEANWKAARTFVDLGETFEGDKRAEYYKQGEIYARRAVRADSMGSKGHLELSVALGRVALDASAKERIRMSKEIKKEVDLAIKYDPNDDIAYHVLGRWNRKISNLSWIEETFANMFLGGVPEEASNENAVECFKKAIEINPGHINHYLELGITYEMMDMDSSAAEAFNKCLELPESHFKDAQYKITAKELLEDL